MPAVTPISNLIKVARGLAPADLILANARVVNIFNGEIESGNVAISGGRIAGIGDYKLARETLDIKRQFVLPGLIDGHTHVESSMLGIGEYARAVIPHGTLGVITDLHEIANVAGVKGIEFTLKASRGLPFELFVMAPPCVPATGLETSGASLDARAISRLLGHNYIIGLGEMMNYPGVLAGENTVLDKIGSAGDRPVDGHAPGLHGFDLNAYIASGITSDHECTTLEEAREKLSRGMYVMIREGSSEKNLQTLLPLVTDLTYKRCLFVVDDRICTDLLKDGDIDAVVRKAIFEGLDPVRAVQLATITAAERFGLKGIGAVSPGYLANIIVMRDLNRFEAGTVFHRGRVVARDGKALFNPGTTGGRTLRNSVRVKPFGVSALSFKPAREEVPVIGVVPGQITTRKLTESITREADGSVRIDIARDILKLVVVERHKRSGNIGMALVKGFGLKRGALASSVAHDSHNIIAVGTNDTDIFSAISEVVRMQGGMVVVEDGRALARLELRVAGLMSDKPLTDVAADFESLENASKDLGVTLTAPFSTLSFLALPVIPELRLTDRGLVDVATFSIISQ
jgi:adenine deaminase